MEQTETNDGGVIETLRHLAIALDTSSLAFADAQGGIGIFHEGTVYIIAADETPLSGEPTAAVLNLFRLASGSGAQLVVLQADGAYHAVAVEDALAAIDGLSSAT